jgi:hypothetical protein
MKQGGHFGRILPLSGRRAQPQNAIYVVEPLGSLNPGSQCRLDARQLEVDLGIALHSRRTSQAWTIPTAAAVPAGDFAERFAYPGQRLPCAKVSAEGAFVAVVFQRRIAWHVLEPVSMPLAAAQLDV